MLLPWLTEPKVHPAGASTGAAPLKFQYATLFGRTRSVWTTLVAAFQLSSPAWLAVMTVDPAPTIVTMLLDTVATLLLELL